MSRIVLIDDSIWVGDAYSVCLSDVIQMEVEFLLHSHQTEDELISLALGKEHTFLLLDAQLSGGAFGPSILRRMRAQGYAAHCIGFSSDAGYARDFLDAGAVGFVRKRQDHPWTSAHEVGEIVAKLHKA